MKIIEAHGGIMPSRYFEAKKYSDYLKDFDRDYFVDREEVTLPCFIVVMICISMIYIL